MIGNDLQWRETNDENYIPTATHFDGAGQILPTFCTFDFWEADYFFVLFRVIQHAGLSPA